jgi:XrtJ-associated TM-motif-TM protein
LEAQLKKLGPIVPVALLLLAASLRAHAQITGCDDSPENPTLVLGLIVSAAGIGFARARSSIRARNNAKRR